MLDIAPHRRHGEPRSGVAIQLNNRIIMINECIYFFLSLFNLYLMLNSNLYRFKTSTFSGWPRHFVARHDGGGG